MHEREWEVNVSVMTGELEVVGVHIHFHLDPREREARTSHE